MGLSPLYRVSLSHRSSNAGEKRNFTIRVETEARKFSTRRDKTKSISHLLVHHYTEVSKLGKLESVRFISEKLRQAATHVPKNTVGI